jgi:hypothetical protein
MCNHQHRVDANVFDLILILIFLIFLISHFIAKLKSDGSVPDCCGLDMHWTDFCLNRFHYRFDLINVLSD